MATSAAQTSGEKKATPLKKNHAQPKPSTNSNVFQRARVTRDTFGELPLWTEGKSPFVSELRDPAAAIRVTPLPAATVHLLSIFKQEHQPFRAHFWQPGKSSCRRTFFLLPKLDRLSRVSRILGRLRHLLGWHIDNPGQLFAPRCVPGRHSAPQSAVEQCSARKPWLSQLFVHVWHFRQLLDHLRHGNIDNLIHGSFDALQSILDT